MPHFAFKVSYGGEKMKKRVSKMVIGSIMLVLLIIGTCIEANIDVLASVANLANNFVLTVTGNQPETVGVTSVDDSLTRSIEPTQAYSEENAINAAINLLSSDNVDSGVIGDDGEATNPGQGESSTEDPTDPAEEYKEVSVYNFNIYSDIVVNKGNPLIPLTTNFESDETGAITYNFYIGDKVYQSVTVDAHKTGSFNLYGMYLETKRSSSQYYGITDFYIEQRFTSKSFTVDSNGNQSPRNNYLNGIKQKIRISETEFEEDEEIKVIEDQKNESTFITRVYYNSEITLGTVSLPVMFNLYSGDSALEFYVDYALSNVKAGTTIGLEYSNTTMQIAEGTEEFFMRAVNVSDNGKIQASFNLSESSLSAMTDISATTNSRYRVGPLKVSFLDGQVALADYEGSAVLDLVVK